MSTNKGLLSSGWSMVGHNKRYIAWFWLLNLLFGLFGTAAFNRNAHEMLDHHLYSRALLHGFDISVFGEMLLRPEFGPISAVTTPAIYFALLFFVATALFLPGVFAGYASNYRLPREDFFRACGRNLWRFIRLMIIAGIVMGIIAGILFAINGAITKKAAEGTNEMLPFELQMIGLAIIFLIMTILRIWFDLAEVDIVLNNQGAVRKSIAAAFRRTFQSLGSLLGSYVLITVVAAIILLGGIWIWNRAVPPERVLGAFLVAQITLFLLLIPRFWQRGVAVSYWKKRMLVPVAEIQPFVAAIPEPAPPPAPPPPITPPSPSGGV